MPKSIEINNKILFEDKDLLIINKPSGILTIPDRYNKSIPSLSSILKKEYEKIFVVHRLDKDTSGAIIFAKNAETHRQLNIDFENNEVIRKYHVVIEGLLPEDFIEIDIPLRQSRKKLGMTIPSAKGKPSLTKVAILEKFRNCTLVECELVTGRHHQIRVHLQTIGHPLLIDNLYGNKEQFYLSSIKKKYNIKKGTEEKPIMSRLTMHSYFVKLKHPKTNEIIEVTADYQKDFAALIQILRKYSSK
ncbi:MAG: RluA family pseudouridine synthase [Candidatus Kapaibacteriota bacterium]